MCQEPSRNRIDTDRVLRNRNDYRFLTKPILKESVKSRICFSDLDLCILYQHRSQITDFALAWDAPYFLARAILYRSPIQHRTLNRTKIPCKSSSRNQFPPQIQRQCRFPNYQKKNYPRVLEPQTKIVLNLEHNLRT
jgi:hypothetical protein